MRHLNLPAESGRQTTTSSTNGVPVPASSTYPSPWLSPPPSSADPPVTATASMAYSLDHSNVDGAEALLAQTETSDDYFPLPASSGPGSTPPAGTGLYHLLDDLINTAPISSTSSTSSKHGEGLGESDPRPDIIKTGVVNLSDANVLVDQSVAFILTICPLCLPSRSAFTHIWRIICSGFLSRSAHGPISPRENPLSLH